MKKFLALALVVLLVGALFVGCSKSSGGGTGAGSIPGNVAGTYVLSGASDFMLELQRDGNYTLSYSRYYSNSGTWRVSGSTITLTGSSGGSISGTVQNDTLTSFGVTFYKIADAPETALFNDAQASQNSYSASSASLAGSYYTEEDANYSLTLRSDGTFTLNYGSYSSASGTWKLSGSTITLDASGERETGTVSGNRLLFDGITFVRYS